MRMIKKVEWFGAAAGVLAIVGVLLNNHRLTECFYFWIVSNAICTGIHVRAKLWSMAVKDLIFLVLAVDGLIRWGG